MSFLSPLWEALVLLVLGGAIGYLLRHVRAQYQRGSVEIKVKQILLDAKAEAQKALDEAKKKSEDLLSEARHEIKEREGQLRKREEKILQKEELVEKRRGSLELEVAELKKRAEEINKIREEALKLQEQKEVELQKLSHLTSQEAREELFGMLEKKYEQDLIARIQKLEAYGQERLEQKGRDILASIIQRLATSTASEVTTTLVSIPSDDMKGKIIGKEGRNIRALERACGVEIVVDDTPGSVIVSSFDPVRRYIAKMALENLILDGRIQPARIEEVAERAKSEMEKMIKDAGEKAAFEIGIFDIDPRLLLLLGRLKFRTSYGQNVLQHSIEMAHLTGMLAAELGADVHVAKKGALLHDIGKAVDHEIQGTHVEIGRRILQKFNEDPRVIQAMQSHHEEYPYETLESIIVQTADAISASRPGARRDTVENYLKRLEDLERIASSFEGVEKSYAIQAGREIRIFVTPEKISDLEMKTMAREIASRIEQELRYPGEIKVHVIRETRALEYAR